jgi:hypothetical protein
MKKIIYLIMAFTMVLTTSCDPMEDIHDAIDAQKEIITGEIEFELSDEDYDELGKSYGNFNSEDEAKELIPNLLADKYPVWGDGSLATVSFKLYNPRRTEKSLEVYTVSSSDYSDLGFNYGNFSNSEDMITFLEWKYPSPADRMLVALTYKYYSGAVNTLKNGFIYVNGEWNFLQGFTKDEYNLMGENFDNFTSKNTAEDRIPIFLKDYYKYDAKSKGDIQGIMYNIYQTDYDDIDGDGRTNDKATYSYAFYAIYDGTAWSEYNNVSESTIKFGHNGFVWVPDNTIKYTLTTADYDSLGTEYGDPGYYNNFDVRSGEPNYESPESILAYINIVLFNNFPGMAEGQKFAVKYHVYSGAAEIWEMKVILSGGAYVLQ